MSVQVATIPDNPWHDRSEHVCYFCQPHRYPPMPEFHTLCARCGRLIVTPEDDPRNEAMYVCPMCEEELKWHL